MLVIEVGTSPVAAPGEAAAFEGLDAGVGGCHRVGSVGTGFGLNVPGLIGGVGDVWVCHPAVRAEYDIGIVARIDIDGLPEGVVREVGRVGSPPVVEGARIV